MSGRPEETLEDMINFQFSRELPLPFYPDECGRLTQLIKGGPAQLPPVKDLIFKNEYEHAACSSVKVGCFQSFHCWIIFLLSLFFFFKENPFGYV